MYISLYRFLKCCEYDDACEDESRLRGFLDWRVRHLFTKFGQCVITHSYFWEELLRDCYLLLRPHTPSPLTRGLGHRGWRAPSAEDGQKYKHQGFWHDVWNIRVKWQINTYNVTRGGSVGRIHLPLPTSVYLILFIILVSSLQLHGGKFCDRAQHVTPDYSWHVTTVMFRCVWTVSSPVLTQRAGARAD